MFHSKLYSLYKLNRHKLAQTVPFYFLACSLLRFTRQDFVPAGCISGSPLQSRRCLSLSLKSSDGAVCSTDPSTFSMVKDGVGIVRWMPVCSSHVSDEHRDEQISTLMIAGILFFKYTEEANNNLQTKPHTSVNMGILIKEITFPFHQSP